MYQCMLASLEHLELASLVRSISRNLSNIYDGALTVLTVVKCMLNPSKHLPVQSQQWKH